MPSQYSKGTGRADLGPYQALGASGQKVVLSGNVQFQAVLSKLARQPD